MRKSNVLNSPRLLELKRGRRRFFLFKTFLYIFALFVIFASLAYISRIPVLNIKGIEVIGSKIVDADEVKAIIEEEISGNYVWFFPKKNILYYPKNNIEKELFDKFKGLQNVSFKLDNSKILNISLTEREGKYVWCGEDLSKIKSECSFMDTSGYVFSVAPYFSGDVYFKFFGELSGDYFSRDIFEKIISFKDALTNMGFKSISLYVKGDEDIEIYLNSNILPPNSPKIILRKDFDLEKISINLQTALDTEPLKSNLKKEQSSLQYIDLRFGNKIYYKFSAEGEN